MAFRDSDGRITIDEMAANVDISCIRSAIEHYAVALANIGRIKGMSADLKGEAADSIREISARLEEQIRLMIEASEVTIGSVNSVIDKYQKLDAQLRDMITGSGSSGQV